MHTSPENYDSKYDNGFIAETGTYIPSMTPSFVSEIIKYVFSLKNLNLPDRLFC